LAAAAKALDGERLAETRRQEEVAAKIKKEKVAQEVRLGHMQTLEENAKAEIVHNEKRDQQARTQIQEQEAMEVANKQRHCDLLERQKHTEMAQEIRKQEDHISLLKARKNMEFVRAKTINAHENEEKQSLSKVDDDVQKSGHGPSDVDTKDAQQLQEKAIADQLKETAFYKKVNSMTEEIMQSKVKVLEMKRVYDSEKREFGCAWKLCPAKACSICPKSLRLHTAAIMSLVSLQCECQCTCVADDAKIPNGMVRMDTDNLQVGSDDCAVSVKSSMAVCQGGNKMQGCLKGHSVDHSCGCSALYYWSFLRKQSETAPLKCQNAKVGVPELPSGEVFSQWLQVCQYAAPLTPPPCKRKALPMYVADNRTSEPSMNLGEYVSVRNTPSTAPSEAPPVAPEPMNDVGRLTTKPPPILHDGFFSHRAPLYTSPAAVEEDHSKAPDCVTPNAPCNTALVKSGLRLKKDMDARINAFKYKWATSQKTWTEYGASVDNIQCGAVFTWGLAVCGLGPTVKVACDTDMTGMKREITVGCSCQGVHVHGIIEGRMPPHMAGPCAAKMESWSARAEQTYMRVEPAETCAAKVIHACKYEEKLKLTRAKNDQSAQSINTEFKVMRLEKTVRAIETENDVVLKDNKKMVDKMQLPIFEYTKIPGFSVDPPASTVVQSLGDCRAQCNMAGPKCRAFSFNTVHRKCAMSGHKLAYDENYVLYIRIQSANGGLGHFAAVAGLKMPSEVESELTTSIAECKYDCLLSPTCTSLSYAKQSQHCVRSQVPMEEGSDWDYYEKHEKGGSAMSQEDMDKIDMERERQARYINFTRTMFVNRAKEINEHDIANGRKPF